MVGRTEEPGGARWKANQVWRIRPSGWWRLSVAEESFLATKHPRTRLAAAAELVPYRQTGRFLKAASDLPPGVSAQLAAAPGGNP